VLWRADRRRHPPVIEGQTRLPSPSARCSGEARGYDVLLLDTAAAPISMSAMAETAEIAHSPSRTRRCSSPTRSRPGAVNLARNFASAWRSPASCSPHRRRRPRRCCALDAAVTGKPIKLMVRARSSMRSRTSIRRASPAAFSAWATWSFGREGDGDRRARQGREDRAKMRKGAFDLDDLASIEADAEVGGMGGVLGMLPGVARSRSSSTRPSSTTHPQAPAGDIGSMTRGERKNRSCSMPRAKARGGRLGTRCRHQQAREDAPADGRHDEDHGQKRGCLGKCSVADRQSFRRTAFWRAAASRIPGVASGRPPRPRGSLPRSLPGLPGVPEVFRLARSKKR